MSIRADILYERLVQRGIVSVEQLRDLDERAVRERMPVEELLLAAGVPKHEVLFCLAARYHAPFVEYDESVVASYFLIFRLDMEQLKKRLWFPLSVREGCAEVIVHRPDDPGTAEDIKRTLGVISLTFRVAVPSDIIRIIEHNFDVNPRFAGCGGRTPLARVRTLLAYRRSSYAHYRTLFAKGRTGLAFIRTGVAFIVIALLFLRVLGAGWYLALEAPLLAAGVIMAVDGVKWYLPARRIAGKHIDATRTEPTWGTCVLDADMNGGAPVFSRTGEMDGAGSMRGDWENLSPVMRRRFLASDRTDMAEDRTALAGHRTKLARARTGLAFTRTGIAFTGLGIGLLRQFPAGRWTVLDASLIALGLVMSAEGFHWYFGGRRSGIDGLRSVLEVIDKMSIWDLVFPLRHHRAQGGKERTGPPVNGGQLPGIWATTGLALERTVLADRRGVMARVRTAMAVARTGMAFVRTGMSIASVGAGLAVYFGTASAGWTVFNTILITAGLALIIDGYRWIVPAERIRKEYPYCFGGMELTVPDYGKPNRTWGTVVFDHEDA
ncbi:MAG: hypothetical protein M0042_06705 [Nitrospiraceae bacterium]|nr:hypothetical protein [Nitrospiraceae bacterium]